MKLNTEVEVDRSPFLMDYGSQILSLGSCFAEHMGNKLSYYKFRSVQNPFGILFHPQALLNVVDKALSDEKYIESEVFQNDDKWHSFFAHSRLSRHSSEEVLTELNSAARELKEACQTSTHIIVTLGTSFIYKHKESGQLVANCHKVPQAEFEKQLTSVDEMKNILSQLIESFKQVNSGVKLIFTVSPVRHIKDGMIENSRSKSHLLSALHSVFEEKQSTGLSYFPSYELLMDEFRDYRFYKRDLIHPSDLAIDLIWNKFKSGFISEAIDEDMLKVEKLQRSLAHRSENTSGEAYEKLKAYQYKFKEELSKTYPFMTF